MCELSATVDPFATELLARSLYGRADEIAPPGELIRKGEYSMRTRLKRLAVGVPISAAVAASAFAVAHAADPSGNPWPYQPSSWSPTIAVVGDISCQPGEPLEGEHQKDVCDKTGAGYTLRLQAQTATAEQIEKMHPDFVAIVGDEQYEVGRYNDFLASFDRTYGAFKFLHRPAPGNHEFYSEHGETGVHGYGYFDYYNGVQLNPDDGSPILDTFNVDAPGTGTFTQPRPRQDGQAGHFGDDGDGWYSYDVGMWHIVSLNVECAVQPGGCDPNGAWFARETRWLAQDLETHHASCTLAYWHQPTFTVADTAPSAEGTAATAWWKLLYQHHADIVLNGHDHTYARYAPMAPNGARDDRRGIREFIVGTGGESLDPPVSNGSTANLQAGTGDYYGVMALTLDPEGYRWDFESALKSPDAAAGSPATFSDKGTARCHADEGGRDRR
jgi:hypothetical protein